MADDWRSRNTDGGTYDEPGQGPRERYGYSTRDNDYDSERYGRGYRYRDEGDYQQNYGRATRHGYGYRGAGRFGGRSASYRRDLYGRPEDDPDDYGWGRGYRPERGYGRSAGYRGTPSRRGLWSRDYDTDYDDETGYGRDYSTEGLPYGRGYVGSPQDYDYGPRYGQRGWDYESYDPYRGQEWEYGRGTRGIDFDEDPEEGPHAGRGPQGYQRSDERIREDANERLTRHGWLDATNIQVEVTNGEITLRGTVANRRAKRMAEDAVEYISGVKDVNNQLRVQAQGQEEQQNTTTAPGARKREE